MTPGLLRLALLLLAGCVLLIASALMVSLPLACVGVVLIVAALYHSEGIDR